MLRRWSVCRGHSSSTEEVSDFDIDVLLDLTSLIGCIDPLLVMICRTCQPQHILDKPATSQGKITTVIDTCSPRFLWTSSLQTQNQTELNQDLLFWSNPRLGQEVSSIFQLLCCWLACALSGLWSSGRWHWEGHWSWVRLTGQADC